MRMSPQNQRLRCMPISVQYSRLSCAFVEGRILIDFFNEQEGAEEELENNNEDAPDDVVGAEVEDKEQEKKDDSIGKHQSI